MTEKKKPAKTGIKPLTKAFWELSRPRQEAFLKNLYELSPENKNLFKLRLGADKSGVFEAFKADIQKETIKRIPKYRKLRLSKINEILRNADKMALPMFQQIDLKAEAWMGMLAFILHKKWLPERYQIATARHLDQYFSMVKSHILEKSEQEDRLKKDQKLLLKAFDHGAYLPHIEEIYQKHFD